MNALYFNSHGGLDKLTFSKLSSPSLQEKNANALIKIDYAALNHLDLWVLKGWKGLKLNFPHIGGSDIAGTVVEDQTKAFPAGTKVAIYPGYNLFDDKWTKSGDESLSPGYRIIGEDSPGGFAEYISVPSKNLIKIPNGFDLKEACAPILSLTTSYRMLIHQAKLAKGESILIVGSGGGVNSLSIQLAKFLGATPIIVLCKNKEKELLAKQMGADVTINYSEIDDWPKTVKSFTNNLGTDIVVDNVGKLTLQKSIISASRGGRILTVGNTSGPECKIDNRYIFAKQLSLIGSTMGSLNDCQEAMKLVFSGDIKSKIDSVFNLENGVKAYEKLLNGQQFGKILLKI